MRVSTVTTDPGYDPNLDIYTIHVTLNGVGVKYCITADEEEGYVICYQVDENGGIMHDNIDIITQRIFGKVKIITHNPTI